ncbi:MAG: ScyD/ScyE family protein [Glaciihabitans sp.]
MKKSLIPITTAVVVASSAVISAPAYAGGDGHGGHHGSSTITAGEPTVVTEGLLSPLSLEVDQDRVALLSQNFAGLLTQVDGEGTVSTVTSAPPGDEIGAVSSWRGTVYYSQSAPDLSSSVLNSITPDGEIVEIADTLAYEEAENPDQVNTYGFVDLAEECAAQIPPDPMGPQSSAYTGAVDSHPYATRARSNSLYLADAGANAILRVEYTGEISTVAVLPPEPAATVTAELAAAVGLPECTVGAEYIFEPVPTDVEVGKDGYLYVTTLPGGPEGPELGARGSVYRVDRSTGETELVATGFGGATGLALADDGTIFVAELFGGPEGTGQVSILTPGSDTPEPLIALTAPAALELRGHNLWVTTDAFVPDETGAPQPIGKLVVVPLDSGDAHGDGD